MTERLPQNNIDLSIADAEYEGLSVRQYERPRPSATTLQETQPSMGEATRRGQRGSHGFYEYPNQHDNIAAERMAGGE